MNVSFQLNKTEEEVPYVLFYDEGSIMVPNHWHKEIEIVYSIKGNARMIINNTMCELCEGEIAVVNSGDVHFYFQTENHKRMVIMFDLMMLEHQSSGEKYRETVQKQLAKRVRASSGWSPATERKVAAILNRLAELNDIKMFGRGLLIRALVYELVVILCNEVPVYSEEETVSTDITYTMKMLTNLEKIFSYVERNYQNPISLQDAAEEVNFTTSYFSRFFKRFTNMTFLNYLNTYRINKAQWQLTNTNKNISQIAEEVGIPNIKTFNRVFRENVHMSPTKYRKSIFEKNE